MAKEEQRQRYEIERKDLNGAIFLNLVGMLCAVSVIGGMIFAAVYLAKNDKTAAAVAIVTGTSVASVIAAFVRKSNKNPAELPQKQPPKKNKKN